MESDQYDFSDSVQSQSEALKNLLLWGGGFGVQFWSNCVQLLFYPSSVFVSFLWTLIGLITLWHDRLLCKKKSSWSVSAKLCLGLFLSFQVDGCYSFDNFILFIFSTSSAALVAVSGVRVTDAAQLPAVRAVVSLRVSGWKSRDRSLAEHQAAFSSAWLCRLRGRNEAADVSPPRPT